VDRVLFFVAGLVANKDESFSYRQECLSSYSDKAERRLFLAA
jgi:hypothetical protein